MRKFNLFLLISVCCCNSLFSKKWNVAVNGNDSFNGKTIKIAIRTFQKVIGVVELGEFLFIVRGIYTFVDKRNVRELKKRFTEEEFKENNDSGAGSSWYIFSNIGFFPNAGQNFYYLTGSSFPKITLTLENGKLLKITDKNPSEKNIYIQSCKINGKPWNQFWFSHSDIKNGGTIELIMMDALTN